MGADIGIQSSGPSSFVSDTLEFFRVLNAARRGEDADPGLAYAIKDAEAELPPLKARLGT